MLNGDISKVKPQFIHLLSILRCPWPLVFLMTDIVNLEGVLIKFKGAVIKKVMESDFKLMGLEGL